MNDRREMPAPWQALCDAFGGRTKLAAHCGVTATTIWRWAHGEHEPSSLAKTTINTIAKEKGITAPFPS